MGRPINMMGFEALLELNEKLAKAKQRSFYRDMRYVCHQVLSSNIASNRLFLVNQNKHLLQAHNPAFWQIRYATLAWVWCADKACKFLSRLLA